MESPSQADMTCILKVDTYSSGWQSSLIRVLKKIQDVSYVIDAERGLAYLSGNISPQKILEVSEKVGKHAKLIRVDYGRRNGDQPTNNIEGCIQCGRKYTPQYNPRQECWINCHQGCHPYESSYPSCHHNGYHPQHECWTINNSPHHQNCQHYYDYSLSSPSPIPQNYEEIQKTPSYSICCLM